MVNIITRRNFLTRSMRAALGAAAATQLGMPSLLRRAMAAADLPNQRKKLLFIFLRGGNDGINTIVPWADDAYNTENRPSLYVPRPDPSATASGRIPDNPDLERAIDLGNGFAGLHPGLVDASPIFNDGKLALIHRVGYPKQSRSHFDSQRYWENGVPQEKTAGSGILYRAVVNTGMNVGREFPAVSVQRDTPLLLRGRLPVTTNLSDYRSYDMAGVSSNGSDREKLLSAITAGNSIPYPEKRNRNLLFGTGRVLSDSIEALKGIGLDQNEFYDTDGTTHLFPVNAASNQKGFGNSSYGFFNNLKVAAQILARTDAVVAGTRLDGFDTHNAQGALTGGHPARMQWIGWTMHALRKFFSDASPGLWEDTVVVTLSEFGRTSKENGNQGTDHAEAGVMFVAGGKVNGGVYQCDNKTWTIGASGSMFQVNGRYLRRSVDYRSVLGEIIRDHLGASAEQLETIIPGYADPRESLQSGGITLDGTRIVGELGLI
ncbi:MAG: DUF1501 domain-containing protein [Verrucomicrobia bacterium]|nr:DUF1501 domain-containing protein [Verrucomicrobiota bacterium]